VGPAVFKTVEGAMSPLAGSIPVRLRSRGLPLRAPSPQVGGDGQPAVEARPRGATSRSTTHTRIEHRDPLGSAVPLSAPHARRCTTRRHGRGCANRQGRGRVVGQVWPGRGRCIPSASRAWHRSSRVPLTDGRTIREAAAAARVARSLGRGRRVVSCSADKAVRGRDAGELWRGRHAPFQEG
jgi:hypothetical protein